MLLSQLREQIEAGKTAKLFAPKTHQNGIDLTILVQKIGDQIVWQREKIEELRRPTQTKRYPDWQALTDDLSGMETRDTTWELCDEKIVLPEASYLNKLIEKN